MTKEQAEKIIMDEVEKKYGEFFEKNKNKKYKDETESINESKEFYKEIEKYIEKRKKELEIE